MKRRAFLKSVLAVPAATLCDPRGTGVSLPAYRLLSAQHVTTPLPLSFVEINRITTQQIMPRVLQAFVAESPFYHVTQGLGPRG